MPERAEGCQGEDCLVHLNATEVTGNCRSLQDSMSPDRYSGARKNLETGTYSIAWASATAWWVTFP